jgi:RNA polymerase sigma-70 factor (ECF subfamily)
LKEELLLRSFLLAATGSVHESDDLFQSVARVLWEKFAEYDAERAFRAWALGVARLEVLKWRQSKARSREVLSEEAISQVAAAAGDGGEWADGLSEFLRTCLAQLKSTARRVMELKYGESLPIREIAARVGKSVSAVEMILVRSRRALRDCVERQIRAEEHA